MNAKIDKLLLELQELSQQLQSYIRQKIPPEYLDRISKLQQNKRFYDAVNKLSNHLLLFLLLAGLGFVLLIHNNLNPLFFFLMFGLVIAGISKVLKIDWSRNQQIKKMYLELGQHIEDTSVEEIEELEDNELLLDYIDKIDDITNVRRIFLQIESDDRIKTQIRSKWYQVWLPSLVSFLNEFYGYPEKVILSRLEFQQKLFERVLLSSLIGFGFIIVRAFPINPQILIGDVLSVVGIFVFLVICLLLISFPLIRYPALKLELAHWITEHDFSLHVNSNHPPRLLNEKEFNPSAIDKIQMTVE